MTYEKAGYRWPRHREAGVDGDEIVHSEAFNFNVVRRDGRLVLSVLLGGVAMYGLEVPLTADEESRFLAKDRDLFLRRLVGKIRRNPELYEHREL